MPAVNTMEVLPPETAPLSERGNKAARGEDDPASQSWAGPDKRKTYSHASRPASTASSRRRPTSARSSGSRPVSASSTSSSSRKTDLQRSGSFSLRLPSAGRKRPTSASSVSSTASSESGIFKLTGVPRSPGSTASSVQLPGVNDELEAGGEDDGDVPRLDMDTLLAAYVDEQSARRAELDTYVARLHDLNDADGGRLVDFPDYFDEVVEHMDAAQLQANVESLADRLFRKMETDPRVEEELKVQRAKAKIAKLDRVLEQKTRKARQVAKEAKAELDRQKRELARLERGEDDEGGDGDAGDENVKADDEDEEDEDEDEEENANPVVAEMRREHEQERRRRRREEKASALTRNAQLGADARYFGLEAKDEDRLARLLADDADDDNAYGGVDAAASDVNTSVGSSESRPMTARTAYDPDEGDLARLNDIDQSLQTFVDESQWEEKSLFSYTTRRTGATGSVYTTATGKVDYLREEREQRHARLRLREIESQIEVGTVRNIAISEQAIRKLILEHHRETHRTPRGIALGHGEEASTHQIAEGAECPGGLGGASEAL